ncbi:MAG: COGs COG3146 [uncultured Thiotrichaceae bacterium]|uniref:COGs COG3146 n=1 Tax=uncultured Thiotrichaceae bacterium TaxID=298394 RepID=A0A6S6U0Q3_9GAMM|nr:MAG: COGs COG3146 [uncultured Thiotrichaceae bacterium]
MACYSVKIKIHPHISEIPEAQWNALIKDDHPFTKHAFLKALEEHNCVSASFGWLPRHIAIYDEDDQLLGAMPLYEKYNSYGEFVFDHAWADAWQRSGMEYFPKLVSATPYTPATGQRLLTQEGQEEIAALLLATAQQFAHERKMSGIHILFPDAKEQDWLETQNLFTRHDCQFHWHNHNYQSFEEFLEQLTAKKRKNIRQERKRVASSSAKLRLLDGHSATDKDWEDFAVFYTRTFEEKWGTPTLNEGFFKQIGQTMPDNIFLVMADVEEECIAGSLMFRSEHTLYGRHWGAIEHIDKLHFEACYYQGIEYCIKHGLQCFEPGAQGEHKIARGFVPTLTRSSHWLTENPFQQSIENYVRHEQEAIAEYMQSCQEKIPYK